MNCVLEFVRQDGDRYLHRCLTCNAVARSKHRDPTKRKQRCGAPPPPQSGPGTEFRKIRVELKIKEKCGGKCHELETEMNAAGVDGCREHRDYFLAKLRKNAKAYGLADWAAAGWQALIQGKPWTLEGLFDLAIRRADSAAKAEGP